MLSTITVLSKTWINKCISPAQWRHRTSECQERPTSTKLIPEISFNNYLSGMVHVMCPLLFLLLVNSKSKTEKNNTPAYLIFVIFGTRGKKSGSCRGISHGIHEASLSSPFSQLGSDVQSNFPAWPRVMLSAKQKLFVFPHVATILVSYVCTPFTRKRAKPTFFKYTIFSDEASFQEPQSRKQFVKVW